MLTLRKTFSSSFASSAVSGELSSWTVALIVRRSVAARFVASYIKTTTQNSFFKTYTSALAAGQGETALHATAVDIPYVGPLVGGKTFFVDRDTTTRTLPDKFYSYAGLGTWS